jgi:cellulose synthase/poly-beta-1,6-N-acetylglucosamine synthase-like glycosyltransferase/peptidoglycan/xylan/chitin deacetylase (PgdA/CDA1 family)
MGKRVRPTEPRAHWALLTLFTLLLLAELCLNGYVTHAGAEGRGPHARPDAAGTVPAAVTGGGPIQHVGADGSVNTRAMPPKTIALTFDDGPDPDWTPKILAVLARYHAHATFFQIGSRVNQYPEISRQVLAAGHEIGSHTFTHVDTAGTPAWRLNAELTLTSNAIAAATGRRPELMRPPYSSTPDAVRAADFAAVRRISSAGYILVLSDHDTEDWRRPGVQAIVSAAQPSRGAGAVVLMHDSGGDRAQTVAALEALLPRMQAQGYRFVTVSEGLGLPGTPRATTAQRWRGQALRLAQLTGAWLAHAMTMLMLLAAVLTGLRLIVQLWCAQLHRRRIRRGSRQPLQYLGRVSVIVPAYNEAANIAGTVRSLARNDYPWLEVIVVDDGSTDGTADIVERLHLPMVTVIRQRNAGKPAALNTGIRHAVGELLVLVDGDTVFQPDAVGRLVQPFRDPGVGAVSGNTKVANRKGLLGRWQHLEYVIGFNLDRRMFDIARCMPTVPGAIGAFRRSAVHRVGGVSAQTLAEDTDFTMAVIRAGWRVVYEPAAVAWTEAPSTLRQLWRQRYRWCYGTMQAMWKHRKALIQRGAAGRLGRRGVGSMLLFQVLLPLCSPMIDIYALYGLIFLPLGRVVAVWAGFTAAQVAVAAYALRLDGERYGPLWSLPLQQIVYRQLIYLVAVQSTVMALLGGRLGWHRMVRTGAASAHAQATARDVAGPSPRPPGRPRPPGPRQPGPSPHGSLGSHGSPGPHGLPGPREPALPRARVARDPQARRPLEQTMSGVRWPSN